MEEIFIPEETLQLVITDDHGDTVTPEQFNYKVATSFNTIIDATIKIMGDIPGGEKTNFSLDRNILMLAGHCEEEVLNVIEADLLEISETQTIEKGRLSAYQDLHNLFKANGLNYAFNIKRKNKPVQTFVSELKKVSKLKKKQYSVENLVVTQAPKTILKFAQGKLTDIGGANPNFHLKIGNGDKYTIAFDYHQTKQLLPFLFEHAYVSFFIEDTKGAKRGKLCDVYLTEESFINRRDFYIRFNVMPKIERGITLHDELIKLVQEDEFSILNNIIKTYNHDSAPLALMKCVLMATASHKKHPSIAHSWDELNEKSNKKNFTF